MFVYKLKNRLRKLSQTNKLMNKIYLFANRVKVRVLSGLSDELFARMKYRENTGRKLNLKNPRTFNEKLWWLKLNNRDPLLTICSDKYKVRDYVKKCGLGHILTKIYGVYDDAGNINLNELPNKVFIKCNHGSGKNIIWDKSKPFDRKIFIKEFNSALKQNYYLQSREWNYKNIEPKIIIEEFLKDEINKSLVDYKFLCFDGKVKLLFLNKDSITKEGLHSPNIKRNVYDRDFNYLNIRVVREGFEPSLIKKPRNYNQMVAYAEILSEPFPFCRVDLYNIDGCIRFGEMTFYPGGANQIVSPESWELKMGEWIDLDSEKIVLK